jgi:hypothetical protein
VEASWVHRVHYACSFRLMSFFVQFFVVRIGLVRLDFNYLVAVPLFATYRKFCFWNYYSYLFLLQSALLSSRLEFQE